MRTASEALSLRMTGQEVGLSRWEFRLALMAGFRECAALVVVHDSAHNHDPFTFSLLSEVRHL
jgi:hypothetical protein